MKEFPLPAEITSADKLQLTIENTSPEGKAGMPPWFAVKWVQLLP